MKPREAVSTALETQAVISKPRPNPRIRRFLITVHNGSSRDQRAVNVGCGIPFADMARRSTMRLIRLRTLVSMRSRAVQPSCLAFLGAWFHCGSGMPHPVFRFDWRERSPHGARCSLTGIDSSFCSARTRG